MIQVSFICGTRLEPGHPLRLKTSDPSYPLSVGRIASCAEDPAGGYRVVARIDDPSAEDAVRRSIEVNGEATFMTTELVEQEGWDILANVVRQARSGKPYKKLLESLKPYVEIFPSIKNILLKMQEP